MNMMGGLFFSLSSSFYIYIYCSVLYIYPLLRGLVIVNLLLLLGAHIFLFFSLCAGGGDGSLQI